MYVGDDDDDSGGDDTPSVYAVDGMGRGIDMISPLLSSPLLPPLN